VVSLLARLPLRGRAHPEGRSLPPLGVAVVAAVGVTVLGLLGLGAAVFVIETLDPTGRLSFGDCLAVAGRLWLLANGGELRLWSGPLILAPLLVTAAIAWALSRTARASVHLDPEGRTVPLVVPVVAGVHVALTLLLALLLDTRSAGVGLAHTALAVVALALVAAGWGAGRESGLLDAVLDRLPGATRPVLRAVLAGALTAVGLCTAVVAIAVAADAHGYAALSGSLGGAGASAVGLLALGVLLLPNAAAAALGLSAGPGFAVGAGTVVHLLSAVDGTLPAVPALPLFAALPDTQAVPLVAFASQAIPAVAGLVAGITLGRWLSDDDGGSVVAGLGGVVTGVLLGAAGAVLTWIAGGALGDGALARVGAPPLETGIALMLQCGIAAALAAAVTRWRAHG
jgi:hypothetical protein